MKNRGSRVALVTGSGGGLGRATACRLQAGGMRVIAAMRALPAGLGRGPIAKISDQVTALELDVTNAAHVARALTLVNDEYGRLDVLVNNAGVYLDRPDPRARIPFEEIDYDRFVTTMAVNLHGPLLLTRAFLPGMRSRDYGRIVNVSSGRSRFSDLDGSGPSYRISKTALNALTRIVAADTAGHDILVNAVCPGWVRTNMGGSSAPRRPREAAEGICWAATLPRGGPTGGFYRDAIPLDWCLKTPRNEREEAEAWT